MDESPFRFVWHIDQAGYEIEHVTLEKPQQRGLGLEREYDQIRPKGGPLRHYWPLDEPGLWLQFAEVCTTAEGALSFVNQFGPLQVSPERLDSFLGTAALIRRIAELLQTGDPIDRVATVKLFGNSGLPTMKEGILWYADRPEVFEFVLVPRTLRDALLHQTGEAIAGNRRFKRCRNENCPNWFRLGPRTVGEGGRTYTARREFCSDRCRVASARQQKREETPIR
jgi:hypothetical protein